MDRTTAKRYNDDWKAISTNIRVHRAQNNCEVCKMPNDFIGHRSRDGKWREITSEERRELTYLNKVVKVKLHSAIKRLHLHKIVLSVAHLNHNERDDRPENLLCACQWCHLKHDRVDNWIRRKKHKFPLPSQLSIF